MKYLKLFTFLLLLPWFKTDAQTTEDPSGFLILPRQIENIFNKSLHSEKPVFLEAFLPTCQHCIAYNKNLDSPEIQKYLHENFQAYRIDMSKKEVNEFLRTRKIVISSTPTFLVFSPTGTLWNLEEAQPENNSIEGIKELLNKAKSDSQRLLSQFENYKKGIFDKKSLLNIAFFTKMKCDTLNNIEIVNKLVNTLKESEFDSEMAYTIVAKMMMDEQNILFDYFAKNPIKYEKYADSLQIKRAIENVIMNALYQKNSTNFSFERYSKMKNQLSAIGIPSKSVNTRFIYFEVLKELEMKKNAMAIQRIKNFYSGKLIPTREKDFWCGELKKFNPGQKVCPL